MEKITFQPDNNETSVEFYVLEQTRLNGTDYILVTDTEEGDGEALILQDLSEPQDAESVYEIVTDDTILAAVADVFENMLDDVDIVE